MAQTASRRYRVALASLLAAGLLSCSSEQPEVLLEGEVQGTTYHIKLVPGALKLDRSALHQEVESLFAEIDRKLSNYRDDSEISALNRQRSRDWIKVSPEIAQVVDIAQQVSRRTDGCYDLTIKPLFDLWGFSRHENRVPTDDEIGQALAHVGMSRIEVDRAGSRIRKLDPETRIDLSSIAQGYTVGAVATRLEQHGIDAYMVEVGGELQVKGRKADGSPWRIAIEKPTPFTREVQRILEFRQEQGTAVMTAGTYRNFFEDQGKVYSHILDPRTGRPVTHRLLSVSVLHDDPTWADAWDTALLCVGETAGARIADSEQLKALLIYQDGDALKEYLSKPFTTAHADRPEQPSPPP